MEETKVTEILEELRQAYPAYKISSRSTEQRGGRFLIVIKCFEASGDIDDWSLDIVYPIFWSILEILEKHEGAMGSLRLLFIRGNQFMLHSPDVGLGSIFREMTKPLHIDVYGDHERQHYVGECRDINDVLEYLQHTHVWF